jgi:hypothetical protein
MSIFTQLLQKKENNEFFLILCIDEHYIRSAITEIHEGKFNILGKGKCELTKSNNLSEVADIAVSEAEKGLSTEILIQNVVFALPPEFTENGDIKPEHLNQIKQIAKDLDLKPSGYVEYPLAISYFMEKQEGSPPTFLLLHIGKKEHAVSFIRIGKIQEQIYIKHESSIATDFHKSLSKIKSDILPARIVIYDGSHNLENIREELLNLPWSKHPSFLHTPKIEIFNPDTVLDAVTEAAGNSLMHELHSQSNEITSRELHTQTSKEDKIENSIKEKSIEEVKPVSPSFNLEETFGFVRGKKIHGETPTVPTVDNDTPETFTQENTEKNIDDYQESKEKKFNLPKINFSAFATAKLSSVLPIITFCLIIIILGGIYFSLAYYYPKSTVNLIVYPQSNISVTDITFSKDESKLTNDKNILLVKPVLQEVSGDKNASVTGKVRVGEKSKGEVTLYNKTTGGKKLTKGTTISGKGIQYLLDEDVNIASASETAEGMIFGKTTAPVTAVLIGPEGNINTDTTFSIKDLPESSFVAKSTKPFSGGSSREVTSVSKEDRSKLEDLLNKELIIRANDLLSQKINSDDMIIDALSAQETVGKKFSGDVGSEAKDLSLNMSLKITAYTYSKNDLNEILKKNISAPDGYIPDTKRFDIKLNNIKTDKNGNIVASAVITSYFIPYLDLNKIKDQISGKNYNSVGEYLKSINTVSGFKIIKERDIPLFGDRLPQNKSNISLSITAN